MCVKCRSAVVESAALWPNCVRRTGWVYDFNVAIVPSSAVPLLFKPC